MNRAGHHSHFLERLERIDDEQVDFAMSLYYDPEFVRVFLQQMSIPEEYDRVAVAIEEDPEGPHILLTREGAFVTCLGRGMRPRGVYPIERREIESIHGLARAAAESAEKLDESWRAHSLGKMVRREGPALHREAVERLFALQPVLVTRVLKPLFDLPQRLEEERSKLEVHLGRKVRRLKSREERWVKHYWEDFFAMHFYSVLVAMGAERFAPIFGEKLFCDAYGRLPLWSWREGMLGPCLRAMWCAAEMGEVIGDYWLDLMRKSNDAGEINCGVAVLATIAFRHPQYFEPIRRLFRGWNDGIGQIPEKKRTQRQRFRHAVAGCILPMFEEPEGFKELFTLASRDGYEELLSQCGAEADDWFGPPDELEPREALAVHAHQIPDLRGDSQLRMLVWWAAPIIAEAQAADMYPPPFLVAGMPGWDPSYGVYLFHNHTNQHPPREPVRVEDEPGRNDPCPCESGRKYKRCCLRKEMAAVE